MNQPAPIRRGPLFWLGVAIGWAFIAYGIRGVLTERAVRGPAEFARWFVGIAIVHDALLVPVALSLAWAVGRVVPRPAVVPVRLGLATTGLLALFTWPYVRGYGRADTNPSALPLDYGRNLLGALIAVWLLVAVWIAAKTVHNHKARRAEQTGARR